MSDCDLTGTLGTVDALDGALGAVGPLTGALGPVASLTGSLGLTAALTGNLGVVSALTGALVVPGDLSGTLTEPPALTGEIGDDLGLFAASFDYGAERSRSDAIKLAAYTTSVNVPDATPVELPTGLIVYPTFKDSGYIEITAGAAHANMNGATASFDLKLGPAGSVGTVATFTTNAVAAGAGNFQFEIIVRLKTQGGSTHNYFARMIWNEPGGGPIQTKDFIGRLTSPSFGDVTNGDQGDVEVRLDAYLSGSGPTFNVRNYTIMQFGPRSGQY